MKLKNLIITKNGYALVRPFMYFDHFHIFDLFYTSTHRLYFDLNFTSTKTELRPVLLDQKENQIWQKVEVPKRYIKGRTNT